MSLVEGVQRRATKFILGARTTHPSFKDKLTALRLLPLTFRREICDIMSFVKSRSIVGKYVSFPTRPTRSYRSHMLTPIRSRTSAFRHTYIPRVVTIWNKLAPDLRCTGERATHPSEVIAFKHKLVKSSFVRFNSQYSIDLPCTWSTACGCSACVALRPH